MSTAGTATRSAAELHERLGVDVGWVCDDRRSADLRWQRRYRQQLGLHQVSFPIEVRPGEGTPTISFAINTEEQFVFDVLTAQCGAGGMPCGNAGAPEGLAEGLTDFSFVDDDPGCCAEPMDALVQWPDLVYIRVYRTTPGSSCAAYQLQVSR